MRNSFIDSILDECASRADIFILSGDAGLGVFDRFKDEYPERFLNMGVAEQNAIGFAAGLALTGYKVLVYNIAPFVLYRCYEQVRNDICYQELPVILAGIGSGITYAPMGVTHYAVEDVGVARTLPNLTVISPMDPFEAKAAARFALDAVGPVYVRLAKRGEPSFHQAPVADISKPQLLKAGDSIAIVFHGSIADDVMAAVDMLARQGISPRVISMPTLQPLDNETLLDLLSGIDHVLCVEEHFDSCGLGAILASLKVEASANWRLSSAGIPARFIHQVSSSAGLRHVFSIDACGIAARITALAGSRT